MTRTRRLLGAYLRGAAVAGVGFALLAAASLLPFGHRVESIVVGVVVAGGSLYFTWRRDGESNVYPPGWQLIGIAMFGLGVYAWMLPEPFADDPSIGTALLLILIVLVPVYLLVVGHRLALQEVVRRDLPPGTFRSTLGDADPADALDRATDMARRERLP